MEKNRVATVKFKLKNRNGRKSRSFQQVEFVFMMTLNCRHNQKKKTK